MRKKTLPYHFQASPPFLFSRQGFTLIELVTVVVIIGILVSFGMPVYNRAMERARDNEAKTNLKLIQSAEKIYWAENGTYYAHTSDPNAINNALHLNLIENLWDYAVDGSGGAQAQRLSPNGGFPRSFSIGPSDSEVGPCSGTCP